MHVIEVLGPGCQKCQFTERLVREVIETAGLDADVRHVTDALDIAGRGVLSTPGLVIDGVVVMSGRVPTRDQVASWLGVA